MKAKNLLNYSLVLFALFTSLLSQARAEIYKWEDAKGNWHYSTKPEPDKKAKPAVLPPIMRGENKQAAPKLQTCDDHGGVDCEKGPDTDGSAVCRDGYKDVSTRFIFSCASPKLEISQISDTDAEGNFTVFVRNAKNVAAKGAKLIYKYAIGKQAELAGPATVDAYGAAEYKFAPPKELKEPLPKPSYEELELKCTNCGS